MLFYIAGVNHNNPIHRIKLDSFYQSLKTKYACAPAFLALEYDQNFATEVIDQRNYFRGICKNEWPNVSDAIVEIISNSLLYEVDSHISTFSQIPILWLDDGREIRQDIIRSYSDDRLKIYRYYLEIANKTVDSTNILDILSDSAKELSSNGFEPSKRDLIFANKIIEKMNFFKKIKQPFPYSIVVVGSDHAKKIQGTMKYYLDDANINNIVSFL